MPSDVIDPGLSVLVLVDFQARLMPAIDRGETVVAVACTIADAARELGIRVIGTEQNPEGLGPAIARVRDRCDAVVAKTHFDACEDGLVEALDEENLPGRAIRGGPGEVRDHADAHVVVAGCEAHVCLMQTSLGLLRRGRRVWVVEDACGSRRESDRRLAMQRLARAGATLVSAEMALFEWLRSCEHPKFKALLRLVKETEPPARPARRATL